MGTDKPPSKRRRADIEGMQHQMLLPIVGTVFLNLQTSLDGCAALSFVEEA